MEKSRYRFGILAAFGAAFAITLVSLIVVAQRLSAVQAADFDGTTVIDPPRPLSDFTLLTQTGDPLSLSDLRGKQVLLLFGYTHCPDVCPLTLSEFARIHDQLGEKAAQVAFVFVSVDGERDTPERLKEYLGLRQVGDFVIGMTGDEATLRRVGTDYNLFFQKQTQTENYLVDHTASTYLIDPEGRLAATFAFKTDPQVITRFIAR